MILAKHLDKDLLREKMTCRWKPWLEEVYEAVEHETKTSEVSLNSESETNRALRREVRKLAEMVSKLELAPIRSDDTTFYNSTSFAGTRTFL